MSALFKKYILSGNRLMIDPNTGRICLSTAYTKTPLLFYPQPCKQVIWAFPFIDTGGTGISQMLAS
jgi:hypothetical protein